MCAPLRPVTPPACVARPPAGRCSFSAALRASLLINLARPVRSVGLTFLEASSPSSQARSVGRARARKTTARSGRPPAHDARVRNRRTEDLGVASLLRSALMKEIGFDAATKAPSNSTSTASSDHNASARAGGAKRCLPIRQAVRFSWSRELICDIRIGPRENSPTSAFRVSPRK